MIRGGFRDQPAIGTDLGSRFVIDVIPAESEDDPIRPVSDALPSHKGNFLLRVIGRNACIDRFNFDPMFPQHRLDPEGENLPFTDPVPEDYRIPQEEQAVVPRRPCVVNSPPPEAPRIDLHRHVRSKGILVGGQGKDELRVRPVSDLGKEPRQRRGKHQAGARGSRWFLPRRSPGITDRYER